MLLGLLFIVGLIILVWKTFTPRGGWDGRDGGWWGRWRPRIEPPQDPPPLPKSWDPPDYIPEWVVQEHISTIFIPRPKDKGHEDNVAPLRAHRSDSPEP